MKEEGQRGCSGVQREGQCGGEDLGQETICEGGEGIKSGRDDDGTCVTCSSLA